MGITKRLRNIAITQINAIKDHLDRIDEEAEEAVLEKRAARDADRELNDPTDIRPTLRSPEEIATGARPAPRAAETAPAPVTSKNPLAVHYRILGVEEGADFSTVEAAYTKLAARCSPNRFPAGSEEESAAKEILKRVESAYNALRDALDATAGRFDKLEL